MKNLNLLFNKTYYDTLTATVSGDSVRTSFPGANACNNSIFGTRFSRETDYEAPGPMVSHVLLMTVCYPGLLIGIGNTHDSGVGDEEIGIGFSFDYVTGQPYIPGSTVKGVLRRHFKDHPQVIAELCGQTSAWVKELETEIFENADIFFDAVVYAGNREGKLLGEEYITPHKSPTEAPTPIKLMKILPEVRFSFRFQLKGSPHMEADEKKALFQKLLCLFGIGAKTNVGFGILRPDETNGYVAPVQPVTTNTIAHEQGSRQNQTQRSQQSERPCIASAGNADGQDSKKCPHCGRWNKRFHPYTGAENRNWVQNICFNCKERMQ